MSSVLHNKTWCFTISHSLWAIWAFSRPTWQSHDGFMSRAPQTKRGNKGNTLRTVSSLDPAFHIRTSFAFCMTRLIKHFCQYPKYHRKTPTQNINYTKKGEDYSCSQPTQVWLLHSVRSVFCRCVKHSTLPSLYCTLKIYIKRRLLTLSYKSSENRPHFLRCGSLNKALWCISNTSYFFFFFFFKQTYKNGNSIT